jgi:hypothetical protein
MGDTGDNTKKVEDIGNSIEGCWKYPKLMILFCLSYRFLVHWHILDVFFDAPTLFLFFVLFLDQLHTILSTTVDDKGRWDSHREVCHHVVGDYNFLTQKKKKFHPITPKLDVPLWFVMFSKSSEALVTMNSLNVCSCALIIHNTYTNVGWFLEVETDTHWLSTWSYLCLHISYQKTKKQALVYNHGFEKN